MIAAERQDEVLAELNESVESERSLVELVRLDYDVTLRALTGFVGAGAQIRSIGIAAWGILLGLGVDAESPLLIGLSLVILAMFAGGDAYHAALYRRALSRAIKLEGLLDAYLERLGIKADDADAIVWTRARLETHRFGMHRTLRPLSVRDLISAIPRLTFWVVYAAIATLTLVVLFLHSI